MAVSIATVYQRVQALVNKEQRGYLTPTEFNLFANKAQMDIFEQYFYDLHQFKRRPGNRKKYNDPIEIIRQNEDELMDKGKQLKYAINTFGVDGEVVKISPGPIISLFEVEPAEGVRVNKFVNLSPTINSIKWFF